MNVKHYKLFLSIFVLAAALLFYLFCSSSRASDLITNETIETIFKNTSFQKAHVVMIEQRRRIQAVMDGFLFGDFSNLLSETTELEKSMRTVVLEQIKMEDGETAPWQAMVRIVTESKELKERIKAQDYRAGYQHFTQLTFECVLCHQSQRSWGVFKEPEPEEEEKKEEKEVKNVKKEEKTEKTTSKTSNSKS